MSLTPYIDNLRVYKANTFSYSFTFEEDESPLDLTTLTNITVRFFNQNTTVFEHSVTGGELTISGASDNIISGSATDEVMDIAVRSYDMEVIFDNSGAITTYVVLNTKVIDSGSNNSTTAASFEVSSTSSTGSIGGQPTVLYAETIEAKNAAEAAQLAAEQAAAGVNLPSIASGDADKFLQVKDDESGYELKANVTLTTDTDVSGNAWVLDEDNFASDSDTKVPTQQSAKKYVDDKASLLQDEIDDLSASQQAGAIGYEDKSTMDADDTKDTGAIALVMNDSTVSNNGYYRYDGTDWIKQAEPIELADNIRSWSKTESFIITGNISRDQWGNVTSADIEWPNEITGVISNVTADRNGWSKARLTYSDPAQYATLTITRNSIGEVETVNVTLTGI